MMNISFKTSNASFWYEDGEYNNDPTTFDYGEVARILREIANKVEKGIDGGKILDMCGNGIGRWDLDI